MKTHPESQLELMEFVFPIEHKSITIYNLMVYGDIEYTTLKNNKLLFFLQIKDRKKIYIQDKSFSKYKLPSKIALTCDLIHTIRLLRKVNIDNHAIILNCSNTLMDLIDALKMPLPKLYRNGIYQLAGRLTFHKEFASFFEETKYKREFIIKGLLKIEEMILNNALIYDSINNKFVKLTDYFSDRHNKLVKK